MSCSQSFPARANQCQEGYILGFFPVVSGVGATSFTVTINDTNPIWYYCGQVGHCQAGMVGVINPPSSGNTLDAYKSAAGKAQTGTNPTVVSGGVVSAVVPASGGSGSSSAAGTSTSVVGISTTAGGSSTSAGGSSTSVGGTSTSAVGTSTSTGKSSGTTGSITSNPASSTSSGVVATTSAPSGVMGIKDTKADVLAMVLALLFGIGTAMLMA